MVAIHPSHIPVINEVFSPSTEELAYFRRLLTAIDAAEEGGSSVIVFEGHMVDAAMAKRARDWLTLVENAPK